MRGQGHRQQRILEVLEQHPGGLAGADLLAAVGSETDEEKKRMRRALRSLAANGLVAIVPTPRHRSGRIASGISSALVSVR